MQKHLAYSPEGLKQCYYTEGRNTWKEECLVGFSSFLACLED